MPIISENAYYGNRIAMSSKKYTIWYSIKKNTQDIVFFVIFQWIEKIIVGLSGCGYLFQNWKFLLRFLWWQPRNLWILYVFCFWTLLV